MSQTLPIILSAPHSMTEVQDPKLRKRFALSDEELFACSDPYTDQVEDMTCIRFKHFAPCHRYVCDMNRPPNAHMVFHKKSFLGNRIFKNGKEFTEHERKEFLDEYWHPYHQSVIDDIYTLDKEGHKTIIVVDFHNTAMDHPLSHDRKFMPNFILSNRGAFHTGEVDGSHPYLSLPAKHIQILRKELEGQFSLPVEINNIFNGGHNAFWFSQLNQDIQVKAKVYCVQFEYNFYFIYNPLTKTFDKKAFKKLHKGIDIALRNFYEKITG